MRRPLSDLIDEAKKRAIDAKARVPELRLIAAEKKKEARARLELVRLDRLELERLDRLELGRLDTGANGACSHDEQ